MDKKPLIGVSILAVVLLVLGPLSNVVGYQSMKSTVNDSPLFQTMTQRANNHQNYITPQYLGKGINSLSFPLRDTHTKMILKVIDRISTMDDTTFIKFHKNLLHWSTIQDEFKDINVQQLISSIYQIRENPKTFERYVINYLPANETFTVDEWFPGCYLYNFIAFIFAGIIFLLLCIFLPTTSNTFKCICDSNLR